MASVDQNWLSIKGFALLNSARYQSSPSVSSHRHRTLSSRNAYNYTTIAQKQIKHKNRTDFRYSVWRQCQNGAIALNTVTVYWTVNTLEARDGRTTRALSTPLLLVGPMVMLRIISFNTRASHSEYVWFSYNLIFLFWHKNCCYFRLTEIVVEVNARSVCSNTI